MLPQSQQLFVVIGGRPANVRMMNLAARLGLDGSVLILDAGNRANPYLLSKELRRMTIDPFAALKRIRIARAFTCHQVVALLEQTLESGRPRQPLLVLDLLSTFYDESVSVIESRRLLENSLRLLALLNQAAPVVVSARLPHDDFPQRRDFLPRLCELAAQIWEEAPGSPPEFRQGVLPAPDFLPEERGD